MRPVLLSLLLIGCAADSWNKPGAGRQDLYIDQDQCEAQLRTSPKGTIARPDFEACMRGRGWTKVQK